MALTITPANVIAADDAKTKIVIAGATITAGKLVYKDPDTVTYKLAQCDGTATESNVAGMALTASSAGQPLVICTEGDVEIGVELLAGRWCFTSMTPGGIEVDLLSADTGQFLAVVGFSPTDTAIRLDINAPAIAYGEL